MLEVLQDAVDSMRKRTAAIQAQLDHVVARLGRH